MIQLETTQLLLAYLYAFPPDKNASRRKKVCYFVFSSSIIVINLLSVTSGGFFIFKNASINLKEAIFALYHTCVCCNVFYQAIIIIILRKKLTALFERLTDIYNESKNQILTFCYWPISELFIWNKS